MASAFYWKARECWRADIRGLRAAAGKRRPIRVPDDRIRSKRTAQADAEAFANECEQLCRLLEQEPTPGLAERAFKIGAITKAQRDQAINGRAMTAAPVRSGPTTILEAHRQHPTTGRDSMEDARKYERQLVAFSALTGITLLKDLTITAAMTWMAHLRAKGYAWDTRRHAMVPLRRASRMAINLGMIDTLAGLRLDRRERARKPIQVWTLPQLISAIALTRSDPRLRGALVLGGFLGLRPTEIARAQVGDLDGDVLSVGAREAKTEASVRFLPVPPLALAWLQPLLVEDGRKRSADAPLLDPERHRRKGSPAYTLWGLRQWLSPELARLAPKVKGPALPPKNLRKCFSTWAEAVIPAKDLERYLGHETSFTAPVTERHYLARHMVEELRPTAALMEVVTRNACNLYPDLIPKSQGTGA